LHERIGRQSPRHHLEIECGQLTQEWLKLVNEIKSDASATSREKALAERIAECGTVINRLILGIHNAKITFDEDGDPLDEIGNADI
jgi:hypothetical protein